MDRRWQTRFDTQCCRGRLQTAAATSSHQLKRLATGSRCSERSARRAAARSTLWTSRSRVISTLPATMSICRPRWRGSRRCMLAWSLYRSIRTGAINCTSRPMPARLVRLRRARSAVRPSASPRTPSLARGRRRARPASRRRVRQAERPAVLHRDHAGVHPPSLNGQGDPDHDRRIQRRGLLAAGGAPYGCRRARVIPALRARSLHQRPGDHLRRRTPNRRRILAPLKARIHPPERSPVATNGSSSHAPRGEAGWAVVFVPLSDVAPAGEAGRRLAEPRRRPTAASMQPVAGRQLLRSGDSRLG